MCNRYSDEKQFWTVTLNARKKIQAKPCTKLKYHVVEQGPWSNRPNYATFNIIVKNPYEAIVNEEYIMYDMVAMISAIGGTLGLCIGFSFTEFLTTALKLLNQFTRKKCEQENFYSNQN